MNIFGRRVTASDYGTGALGATVDSDYFEARYNVIHHSEGEGLGVYNFSDDAIVEFNKVYDNIRPNIYMSDILRPTVRYNLVFGTADTAYNGCSGCWSSGIGFAAENEVSTAGYGKMYGNLIANQVQGGIFVWTSYITSPGHLVYNNTVVDCEPGIDLGNWGTGSLEVTMKNNAVNFVSTTGTKGIRYLTASYPFADHGKALCLAASHGFVKLLCTPPTGELLGAQIVGPEAGELIHELIAVMYYHGTVADLLQIPHYHPTLAEIVTYPAESLMEQLSAG